MLWYKGWLETRWRMLFSFGFVAYSTAVAHWGPMKAMEARMQLQTMLIFWLVVPIMLASSGIKTQASFRSLRGVHGSMLYTLTLPVSRFRLIVARYVVGALEIALVYLTTTFAIRFLSSTLSVHASYTDALKAAFVMAVCGTFFHSMAVLLSTFLDDLWQVWGSMLATGILFWISKIVPVPRAMDVFRTLTLDSPLITHAIPWAGIGTSLIGAAILFFAAVKIAEAREY